MAVAIFCYTRHKTGIYWGHFKGGVKHLLCCCPVNAFAGHTCHPWMLLPGVDNWHAEQVLPGHSPMTSGFSPNKHLYCVAVKVFIRRTLRGKLVFKKQPFSVLIVRTAGTNTWGWPVWTAQRRTGQEAFSKSTSEVFYKKLLKPLGKFLKLLEKKLFRCQQEVD